MNLIFFLQYTVGYTITGHMWVFFQFASVNVRINSLNACFMLWSSTLRRLKELTIHDNSYQFLKNRITFATVSTSGITK